MYPQIRPRRLRKNEFIRTLVRETKLAPADFIMPYFVIKGREKKETIDSLPAVYRLSIDNLAKEVEELIHLGIKAILLFSIASQKNKTGSEAFQKNGLIQKAIERIKRNHREITIITDVCLCGYTTHGHCGLVKNGQIDNDATLKLLARIAVSHAEAGADFVAPSAMMDGQVKAIRKALDKAGFETAGILSYSAKYASQFYGPFREALDSSPQFGDRKSYQMDPANTDEAMREIAEDLEEGADIVMVKPALAYLDIIHRAKENFNIPIAAYNVSGEYSLAKAAGRLGLMKEKELIIEILTAIKRAGADLIITYHAKEAASYINHRS